MNKFRLIVRVFLSGLVSILFFSHSLLAQKVEVKIEDGIPVVYNPKEPSPPPNTLSHLTLKEDLKLGGESTSQEYPFSYISFMDVDDDENIIILDNEEACIKIFDKNGKRASQFGRRGEGPGEIQYPSSLTVVGTNKIGVIDPRNHRFTCFAPDGTCLKEINLEKYWRIERVKSDNRGYIYGNFYTYTEAEKEVTLVVELIKFDGDFKPVMTIASFEHTRKLREIDMTDTRFGYALREDNSLVWGVNTEYVLHVVDLDGQIVRKIVKDYHPMKITKEERKIIYYNRFGDRQLPSEYSLNYPKHYPPFRYVICDSEGRIYVRTYKKTGQREDVYDVFDAEGRYISRFTLPEEDMLFVVKKNKAYVINREDIPSLTRYTMVWE